MTADSTFRPLCSRPVSCEGKSTCCLLCQKMVSCEERFSTCRVSLRPVSCDGRFPRAVLSVREWSLVMAGTTCCLLVGRRSLVKDDCTRALRSVYSTEKRRAYRTVRHSTRRHGTTQCITVRHSTALGRPWACGVLHGTAPCLAVSIAECQALQCGATQYSRHADTQPRSHAATRP